MRNQTPTCSTFIFSRTLTTSIIPILVFFASSCMKGKNSHHTFGVGISKGSAYVPANISSGTTLTYTYRERAGSLANSVVRLLILMSAVDVNTHTEYGEDYTVETTTYSTTQKDVDRVVAASRDLDDAPFPLEIDIVLAGSANGGDTQGSMWSFMYPVIGSKYRDKSGIRLLAGVATGDWTFADRTRTVLSRQGNKLVPISTVVPQTTYDYFGTPVRLEVVFPSMVAYWQEDFNMASIWDDTIEKQPSPTHVGLEVSLLVLHLRAEVIVSRWAKDGFTGMLEASLGI